MLPSHRPLVLSVSLGCACAMLVACGSTPADTADPAGTADPADTPATEEFTPVSVENCGRTVTIDQPIENAVAVNQPALELLLSLGLEDRIRAYAISDDGVLPELDDARETIEPFDVEFPSFEAVVDVEPDFVYTTFDYTFTAEGIADRERFDEFGVATYQSPSECGGQDAVQEAELSLDDLYTEINEIATLFGVEERGAELVESLRERAETATEDLGADDVTLAWWYAATSAPYMAGCCGAPGIMTRAVGATNAFEDSRQYWPDVSWESVVDRDPTVLVLADLRRGGDGDSAADKIAFLESDPVTSGLTAVQNERYIILDGTTMDPSIRNIGGIEELADGLRELGVVE